MTWVYVDATTLIALGTIGELALLTDVGDPVVLPSVQAEVTTEPAGTNLDRWIADASVRDTPPIEPDIARAVSVLGDDHVTGDAHLLAAVLAHLDDDDAVGIVSDDRRVRTVTRGLGATVTGTIGVLVRSVESGRASEDAMEVLRRIDAHGLHMTAELRERAERLIENAEE